MTLDPGTKLGPYVIEAPIGAGGMGEVYRARDTRLDRTVAIKVIGAAVAGTPELRERFEREARAISSLDHPHICALYDVGREKSVDFLVMQYLEGETLAERLKRGPLPVEQTVAYAIQIADALDKAHRRGIIHRDLKPGNIMLTKTGARLLDFGLAKRAPQTLANAATLATQEPITAHGAMLGTIQYMAPEQIEGKDADARSDLFAFGAVLYEMLTGRRAFEGDSSATIMSAILRDDPPSASIGHPQVPTAIDRVIRRCLAKDPDERWQTAADLKEEVKWVAGGSGANAAGPPGLIAGRRGRGWRTAGVALAVAAALAAGVAIGAYFFSAPPAREVMRFAINAPPNAAFTPAPVSQGVQFALSPDGRQVAFVASSGTGPSRLWVRSLDGLLAHPLEETDGASFPFWSPDSRHIGFFARGKLKRIPVAGGTPQVLADAASGRGGAWSPQDVIVFTPTSGWGLSRIPASGGTAAPATDFDRNPAKGVSAQYWPMFLPDGRRFLFFALAPQGNKRGIYVGSLDSKETRHLLQVDTQAVYAHGHLLYLHQGALMARPFDADRLEWTGAPVTLAERVAFFPNFGHAAISISDSTLAYNTGFATSSQLVWHDRAGKVLGTVGPVGRHIDGPRLSPDERRVTTTLVDPQIGTSDIWLLDLARGTTSRFTFHPSTDFLAVWSPDGSRIAFTSDRSGAPDLYQKPASGAGNDEPLLSVSGSSFRSAASWSSDGRFIVFHEASRQGYDLGILSVKDGTTQPFLATPSNEMQGRISPDGKWIAYTSDESGRHEVYVQPLPASGGKWQISTDGGSQPEWRRDGKELFYVSADRKLMAVAVTAGPAGFDAEGPRPLFDVRTAEVSAPYFHHYAASADGQRFLINTIIEQASAPPITVVVNWLEALKR